MLLIFWLALGTYYLFYNADLFVYDKSIPVERYVLALAITLIASPVYILADGVDFIIESLLGEVVDEEPIVDESSEN